MNLQLALEVRESELAQDELSTQQKFPLVNAFPLIPFCFGKLGWQKENGARQTSHIPEYSQKCQEELGSDCQMALGLHFFLQPNFVLPLGVVQSLGTFLYLCNDPQSSPP